jgi:hypothetical protein
MVVDATKLNLTHCSTANKVRSLRTKLIGSVELGVLAEIPLLEKADRLNDVTATLYNTYSATYVSEPGWSSKKTSKCARGKLSIDSAALDVSFVWF